MGLGLLGRGVGDVAFLMECGADIIVTDLKTEDELIESIKKLEEVSNRLDRKVNLKYTFGEHKIEDFNDRDLILVAAGVPTDSIYLAHARKNPMTEITQSATLFARLSNIPMIGVTGTRGKSTVTNMIHHVLETVTGEKVIKGGNIRGVSNLQLLKEIKKDSLAVFELDSWQLQGFGWASISPQIAVFTTFMDDHLNYYKGDVDAYFADKANIFLNQDDGGVFVTTPTVFQRVKKFAEGKNITLGQEVLLVDSSLIPEDAHLAMPGEHNRLNAALTLSACRAMGISDDEIFEALASFKGVEGRLQLLANYNGVKIYNDNNATTPEATVAGLKAVGNNKNVILIMGGADKDIDLNVLVSTLPDFCKKIILLPGKGTDRLKTMLDGTVSFDTVSSLKEAVEKAVSFAERSDVILFSPAFASFGLFKNEYDRNDQFLSLIQPYVDPA